MFRNEAALPSLDENEEYDLIVVGSGNGACGFLQQVQKFQKCNPTKGDLKILVLEEGNNYFYTSSYTHQNGWSKTYSSSDLFKVHNAVTPRNYSVLAGRARTMGGGGSINYTMIHESNKWLASKMGNDAEYWEQCKVELNAELDRPDPFDDGYMTPFAEFILEKNSEAGYERPKKEHMTKNIPSFYEFSSSDLKDNKSSKQLYQFPTQFNEYGQRTNSGVSLVNWQDVTVRWEKRVTGLKMVESNKNGDSSYECVGVEVENTKTRDKTVFKVKQGSGKVILCAGSQSPRLLMDTEELWKLNDKIGKRVNDHICMPLAIYEVAPDQREKVGPTDNYESIFATMITGRKTEDGDDIIVNIDFFSGELLRLVYLFSSLYLCYVIPINWFKRFMGRNPIVFTLLSNTLRLIITVIVSVLQGFGAILNTLPFGGLGSWLEDMKITTALIKFNSSREGYYEKNGDKIVLRFFDDESSEDYQNAYDAINANVDMLGKTGKNLVFPLRFLLWLITRAPRSKGRPVRSFVDRFAKKCLLSEQHLAGGCIFGDVVDQGLEDSSKTGRVFGSKNVHVADLSTVPLPRVSTQMTAYLIGHHVGKQLYFTEKKTK